ncbi:MAG: TonB system transport protein ExbD [Oceanicaulis sp.]|nr:TonB system transport protein ExbD [Oceanicaulis sp.]
MALKLDHDDESLSETSDINVTPFIDVMLVLLIIFMVAAPLATVDIEVDLPASTAQRDPPPEAPRYLTVRADLSLALGETAVSASDLATALDRATENNRQARIFLRADQSVSYGDLMAVMNDVRDAGYLKLALVGLDSGRGGPD